MAEMKYVDVWAAKTSSNTGYSQPRQVPEATIRAFHITVNSPLLQSEVDQSLGWKLIVQWCGYMLVVLV